MAKDTYNEIGAVGLQYFSGQITQEFLRELRGREAVKRYEEMRLNSPVIGALLLANELSIRKVSWNFVSDEGEEDPRVELLEASRRNLRTSWNDFIIECLTFLPFGFSLFEILYERVDSQILWRKFAPRGQDTVYRWKFNEPTDPDFDPKVGNDEWIGVIQQAAPRYQYTEIPAEKLLLFRARVERNNPEGRSILRQSWIPYYYAKHIQQIEAIGIERDLAGLPVITLPPGANTEDTDTSDFGVAQKMVRNVRNDEQAGIVLPSADWSFSLVSTGGSRQFDTDKIVRRYESRMLMSALAQFIALGQDGVGSLALSKDSTDMFVMAVNATADIISETFTKYAVARLLKLNGYDADGVRLEHTPAGDVDATAIADFLQKVGGMITWDAQDELWLRQLIGLPERDVEDLQGERDEKQQMDNAKSQAILEGMKKNQQEPQDEPPDKEDTTDKEKMTVTRFAANAPDDMKRRRFERQVQNVLEKRLAKMKRDVMRTAKEMKQNV